MPVFESWRELLKEFSALDVVTGPLSYHTAATRLRELAAGTNFQPRDPGAPVQIMGVLEAAGSRFDALWILGATDQTWPAPSHTRIRFCRSLRRRNYTCRTHLPNGNSTSSNGRLPSSFAPVLRSCIVARRAGPAVSSFGRARSLRRHSGCYGAERAMWCGRRPRLRDDH